MLGSVFAGLASTASLPSRGAWIEIGRAPSGQTGCRWSLPSRGAWIEIAEKFAERMEKQVVAPLAGSVDRNRPYHGHEPGGDGRSPRGERG